MRKHQLIPALYLLVGIVNLSSHLLSIPSLETYSKPLLMPILLYYVYERSAGHVTLKTLLLAIAIIFSWGGDIALMYGDDYFIAGLGSFLIAQITYVFVFSKAVYNPIRFSFPRILPILIYGILLFTFLLPRTGQLLVPVLIYGLSILSMVSMANLRKGLTSESSFKWTILGAALFLASDSILGLNKFVIDIQLNRFIVMLTYISAQYFIVRGILDHAD